VTGSDNAKSLPSLKNEDEYELVHVGLLSPFFAGLTAVLAKVGVAHV